LGGRGPFKRVDKGIYTLADQPTDAGNGEAAQPADGKAGSKGKREQQAATQGA
jgi:hypothetical protein